MQENGRALQSAPTVMRSDGPARGWTAQPIGRSGARYARPASREGRLPWGVSRGRVTAGGASIHRMGARTRNAPGRWKSSSGRPQPPEQREGVRLVSPTEGVPSTGRSPRTTITKPAAMRGSVTPTRRLQVMATWKLAFKFSGCARHPQRLPRLTLVARVRGSYERGALLAAALAAARHRPIALLGERHACLVGDGDQARLRRVRAAVLGTTAALRVRAPAASAADVCE
jgi:hypothetical protein